MPAKSPAQKRLMDAAAHNPAFAKKVGVPVKVAKEFSKASKGKTFKKGGDMATTKMGKPVMKAGMSTAKVGMKKPTPMAKTAMAGSMGMRSGGNVKKMNSGGQPVPPLKPVDYKSITDPSKREDAKANAAYDKLKNSSFIVQGKAKGGKVSASSRADGIAQQGKTKGKLLNTGGMAKKKYC
jgi:hypothetical protein